MYGGHRYFVLGKYNCILTILNPIAPIITISYYADKDPNNPIITLVYQHQFYCTCIDSTNINPIDSTNIKPIDSTNIYPIDSTNINPIDSTNIYPIDSTNIYHIDSTNIYP